jgi:hypothetical protein
MCRKNANIKHSERQFADGLDYKIRPIELQPMASVGDLSVAAGGVGAGPGVAFGEFGGGGRCR